MKNLNLTTLALITSTLISGGTIAAQAPETISVTNENFTHAETARNYRNWGAKGLLKSFSK